MHVLILGGSRLTRVQAALAEVGDSSSSAEVTLHAATLPFTGPVAILQPSQTPRIVRIDDLDRAFPNNQSRGTRLILTQSTYLLQKLIDELAAGDRIIATADRAEIERNTPEVFFGRGPWNSFELVEIPDTKDTEDTTAIDHSTLAEAYRSASTEERLHLCRSAVVAEPTSAVAWLALASACRENQEIDEARVALESAARLAPAWEAVAYESGKFWLAQEEMGRASDAFRRASELMPTFSAAFGNLGATLGELGEPEAALAAFERALETDPGSFTVLNNIGVVNRELGRLDDAIAASRRVIDIAPDFVFGHYNLGHTLFLAGRFSESLTAYEAGQDLDPEKNRRQGCRIAVVRFANGDVDGAERDLWRFANAAPPDEREDLLLEAHEITRELLATQPQLAPHVGFLDRIAARLASI